MIRIALVGCSKTKVPFDKLKGGFTPARDLYASDLFRKRVSHVESLGLPWYILSAKGGLVNPSTPLRHYNTTLKSLTEIERAEWSIGVANQLMTELYYEFGSPELRSVHVELHAGGSYCEPLGTILGLFGITVVKPVAGLGIGKQLAFYGSSAMPCTG